MSNLQMMSYCYVGGATPVLTKLSVLAGDQLRCDITPRIILSRSMELHRCPGRIMRNCFTGLKV